MLHAPMFLALLRITVFKDRQAHHGVQDLRVEQVR